MTKTEEIELSKSDFDEIEPAFDSSIERSKLYQLLPQKTLNGGHPNLEVANILFHALL